MHEINYISKVKQYCERKGRKFLLLFVLDKVLWVILNNSETFPFSDKRLNGMYFNAKTHSCKWMAKGGISNVVKRGF